MSEESSFINRFGYLLGAALFIVVVIFAIYAVLKPSIPETNLEKLADCLTENGAIFYGTTTCSHCKKQKELLAEGMDFINYIDCGLNNEACTKAQIRAYPTWLINGEKITGQKSLQKLSDLSNCSLN